MVMLNDLLRRIPLLAVVPVIMWLLGMTVYISTWKAENDYKLARVLDATSALDKQTERIIALEQRVIYLADYVREMKESMKGKVQ